MSMSDHIKQRVYKNFLPIRSPSPGKQQNWILLFYQSGRTSTHRNFFCLFAVEAAVHTVLICCTMCGIEQPKEQPEIGDRGSNPVAINQFFFSLLGSHVLVFFFHLLIFVILHGLFNLI